MNPVVEYINNCDKNSQEIMFTLHDIFINDFGLSPKIKFRIPFYYGKSWVIYLNTKKDGGIELCYLKGYLIKDPTGYLKMNKRKQVGGVRIHNLEHMPLEAIYTITQLAIELDQK